MIKRLVLLSLLLIPLFLTRPAFASTQRFPSQAAAILESDEVIDGNYYTGGEIVEIYGTVTGDVYAFGGQVLVDGIIEGDLITAGGVVNISGTVAGNVRAAGGQVFVDAQVGKNLSLAGGNIELSKSATIGKALQIAGGNLTISSAVNNEVLAAGGNLTFRGSSQDFQARVGNLYISSGSQIDGNLDYWTSEEPTISSQATITGTTTQHEFSTPEVPTAPSPSEIQGVLAGINLATKLISLTTTLILGLLLIKLFPNCTRQTIATLRTRPWASLGLGLATVVIFPILIIFLLIGMVTIPLALIALSLFSIYLYFARLYAILAVGRFLTHKTSSSKSLSVYLVLGLIAYYALTFIPIFGFLIKLSVILISLGGGLLSAKANYSEARKAKIF